MSDLEQSGSSKQPPRWLRPVLYAAAVLFIAFLISPLGQRLTSSPSPEHSKIIDVDAFLKELGSSIPREKGAAVVYLWDTRPWAEAKDFEPLPNAWLSLSANELARHQNMLVDVASTHDQMKLRAGVMPVKDLIYNHENVQIIGDEVHFHPQTAELTPPRDDMFEASITKATSEVVVIPSKDWIMSIAMLEAYKHAVKSTQLADITLVILTPSSPGQELKGAILKLQSHDPGVRVFIWPGDQEISNSTESQSQLQQKIHARLMQLASQ